MLARTPLRKKIAVVGTGISGLSAAWLLSERHDVTVFERGTRAGGHSNTVLIEDNGSRVPIDTGFIVYNEKTYPNLTALFAYLGVPTARSEMSFSVSLDGGRFEYSSSGLAGLLAQKRNLVRPRFWAMLLDLMRFYREAPKDLDASDASGESLGAWLEARRYGKAFREDHLLPVAAAIWSAPLVDTLDYPAASFLRFFQNHGLLTLRNRPEWRTVVGGSRTYVARLTENLTERIRLGSGVAAIRRAAERIDLVDCRGQSHIFDDVVIAAHADDALAILDAPSDAERQHLGAFRYSRNNAVLHSDPTLMPRRRSTWSSWNHIGNPSNMAPTSVTYWMNRLQSIPGETPYFVSLNPHRPPARIWHSETYDHPVIDAAAIAAQRALWSLQGHRNTWFCGSYFGAGFHEDGLQSGLAVAEALGGVRRPWSVPDESGRIFLGPGPSDTPARAAA